MRPFPARALLGAGLASGWASRGPEAEAQVTSQELGTKGPLPCHAWGTATEAGCKEKPAWQGAGSGQRLSAGADWLWAPAYIPCFPLGTPLCIVFVWAPIPSACFLHNRTADTVAAWTVPVTEDTAPCSHVTLPTASVRFRACVPCCQSLGWWPAAGPSFCPHHSLPGWPTPALSRPLGSVCLLPDPHAAALLGGAWSLLCQKDRKAGGGSFKTVGV